MTRPTPAAAPSRRKSSNRASIDTTNSFQERPATPGASSIMERNEPGALRAAYECEGLARCRKLYTVNIAPRRLRTWWAKSISSAPSKMPLSKTKSVMHTSSAARAARARRPLPACLRRRFYARAARLQTPTERARTASLSPRESTPTSTSSMRQAAPASTTSVRRSSTACSSRRRAGATRSTSSMRSTCSRWRRSTRC